MKRIFFLLLLFALLPTLLGACGELPTPPPTPTTTPEPTALPPTAEPATPPPPAGKLTVYDANRFFLLEYPAAWELVERTTENSVLLITPKTSGDDPFRENVGVMRQELADGSTTLGDYTRQFLDAAPETIDNYELVSSEPVKLSGLPAHRVIYAGSQNGVLLGWLQVWTISRGNAYVLTYTGTPAEFETFLDDANGIIESFTLK